MGHYVLFRLGQDAFGLDVDKVTEVVRSWKVQPVPEMPQYIVGVINVRGRVVPLVDMRKRLEIAPMVKKERVLLTRTTQRTIGLLVDEVKGIRIIKADAIEQPPMIFRGLKSKYLEGLVRMGDSALMLLDVENILSSDETMRLEAAMETIEGNPDHK